MTPAERFARPDLIGLQGYVAAGHDTRRGAIKIDANEAPDDCGTGFNRYPGPQDERLIDRFSETYGVTTDKILATCGSDQGIDLLVRTFCRAGRDAIAVITPTFGMYQVAARLQGAFVVEVPADRKPGRFENDLTAYADAITASSNPVKLAFLCSPNNPTGHAATVDDVAALAARLADQCLVVLDQAYVEFAPTFDAAPLLSQHPNLVVLRTLSKGFGLAGVRCGALLADPSIVSMLSAVIPPYPIAQPSIEAALKALDASRATAAHDARINDTVSARDRLRRWLNDQSCCLEVFDSSANFLLARFRDPTAVYQHLVDCGIKVRDMRNAVIEADALRITIGSTAEMNALRRALEQMS